MVAEIGAERTEDGAGHGLDRHAPRADKSQGQRQMAKPGPLIVGTEVRGQDHVVGCRRYCHACPLSCVGDFCYYSCMGSDATKLLEAALKLPPEARAAMAGSLLESLDTVVDPDAEAEWDREIARRLKDLDTAPTRVVSWSDARRKILGR